VAGSLALAAPVARAGFVGDDLESVLAVAGPGRGWGWLTGVGVGGHYRPVTFATYRLDHALGGLHPLPYHLTTAVLHGVAAWLVGLVVATLWVPARTARGLLTGADPTGGELIAGDLTGGDRDTGAWFSAGAAAVAATAATIAFLVSPAHGEPLAWVAARADPLLACWALVVVWAWARFRRGGGRRFGAAAIAAFALALGTKESAVALPLVLVAHDLWLPGGDRAARRLARRLADLWPFVVLVVGYLVAYAVAEGSFLVDEGSALRADGPLVRARRGVQVVVRSVVPALPRWAWWPVLPLGAVGAVALAAAVAGAARSPAAGRSAAATVPVAAPAGPAVVGFLATAWLVVGAPVARFGVALVDPGGERLAYLPSAFALGALAVAAVVVLEGVDRRTARAAVAVAAVAAVLGAGLLVVRERTWRQAGRLADAVVADAGAWPRDRPVLLLGTPDTLRGVPVLRNGLYPALVLRHGWADPAHGAPPRAYDALPVALRRPGATVSVAPGPCRRCLTLRIDPADGRFAPARAGDDLDVPGYGLAVRSVSATEAVVALSPTTPATAVWLLSGGRLVPIPPPA
jgi:hypothetical protein